MRAFLGKFNKKIIQNLLCLLCKLQYGDFFENFFGSTFEKSGSFLVYIYVLKFFVKNKNRIVAHIKKLFKKWIILGAFLINNALIAPKNAFWLLILLIKGKTLNILVKI
jgi:hypothetical protein